MRSLESNSIALLVCRWGGWPGWTPLLLRTFAANPSVTFFLISDVVPVKESLLSPNVKFVPTSLEALLARLRSTVGCRLKTLRASGTFAAGPSSAKTNDLKPFFGVAFADMLSRFAWWGYLQEDLFVGNLRAFATDEILARSDVICPYLSPLNASGVLMLFRNVPAVNYLWRLSKDVDRVLSSSSYLVFDEWWGGLASGDNLARVLGRESSAGRIRLTMSGVRRKWMADDKLYPRSRGAVRTNPDFIICWAHGRLWGALGGRSAPCFDRAAHVAVPSPIEAPSARVSSNRQHEAARAAGPWSEVAVVHFSRLKREQWLSSLHLDAAANSIRHAESFLMTARGIWLPKPTCDDNTTWTNRYGAGCVEYEIEGHCAQGMFRRGHEWAAGAHFGKPQRECCACGRAHHHRHGGVAAVESRHLWVIGQLHREEEVTVRSLELAGYARTLEVRDGRSRCNPKRQPCIPVSPDTQAQPPCVIVQRGSAATASKIPDAHVCE